MSISGGAVVTVELLVDVEFVAFTVGAGVAETELLTNVVTGAIDTDGATEDDDMGTKVGAVTEDTGAVISEVEFSSARDDGVKFGAENKLVDGSVESKVSELPDSKIAAAKTAPRDRTPRNTAVASADPRPKRGILEPS